MKPTAALFYPTAVLRNKMHFSAKEEERWKWRTFTYEKETTSYVTVYISRLSRKTTVNSVQRWNLPISSVMTGVFGFDLKNDLPLMWSENNHAELTTNMYRLYTRIHVCMLSVHMYVWYLQSLVTNHHCQWWFDVNRCVLMRENNLI